MTISQSYISWNANLARPVTYVEVLGMRPVHTHDGAPVPVMFSWFHSVTYELQAAVTQDATCDMIVMMMIR